MKLKAIVLSVCFVATSLLVYAQDQKQVIKEWEKKKKEMTPLAFKQLVEDAESSATKITDLESQLATLRSEAEPKDQEIERLKSELAEAQRRAEEAASAKPATASAKPTNMAVPKAQATANQGVVFKVQIGAFKNKDLTKYFDNSVNFSGEVDADGSRKYTLGYFRDYWEADRFKKYLREMGVSDAWIVSYKDGKRVPIKDVLEGAL